MEKKVLPNTNRSKKVTLKFLWTSPKAKQWAGQGFKLSQKFSVFGAGYRIGTNLSLMLVHKRKHPKLIKEIVKDSTLATTVGYLIKTTTASISRTALGEAALSLVSTHLRTLASASFTTTFLRSFTTLFHSFKTHLDLIHKVGESTELIHENVIRSPFMNLSATLGFTFATTELLRPLLTLGTALLTALLAIAPAILSGIVIGMVVCLIQHNKKTNLKKTLA